jgi:hypothetical protein
LRSAVAGGTASHPLPTYRVPPASGFSSSTGGVALPFIALKLVFAYRPVVIFPVTRFASKSSSAPMNSVLSWLNSAWCALPSGVQSFVRPISPANGSTAPKSVSPMNVGFAGRLVTSRTT